MDGQTSSLREFGKFRLDAERRTLRFENRPIDLPLKEIEMLCVLTEKSGEIVTKEELLRKVWADAFVEESNLSRHIYILRKLFKDYGESGELIQTVPRRGYRFAGEVRTVEARELIIEKRTETRTLIEIEESVRPEILARPAVAAEKRLRPHLVWPLAALTAIILLAGAFVAFNYRNFRIAAARPKIESLAVLPFAALDAQAEGDQAGLGLTDVLITRLGAVREVGVRPTSAVLAFDGRREDSVAFGRKLQVDAVLEGSIYRTGDKVRVTARLVSVPDGALLWTGYFEKLAADELKLQDEIALQLIDALSISLNGGEKSALRRRYTESADAHRLYLKGRYHWNQRSWQNMITAEQLFRQAIEEDPKFALAYVGLADTLATRADATEAVNAVQKAIELDPQSAEAHAARGFIRLFHEWDWPAAEADFEKSIELNPHYATAHHWHSQVLAVQGRHEEAKAALRRALEINPLSYNFLADLGQVYYFNREYAEAEKYCRRALEINPDFYFAHQYLQAIYQQTGEYEKAIESGIAAAKINLTFANQSEERKRQLEAGFEQNRRVYREGGFRKFIEAGMGNSSDAAACYFDASKYALLGEKEKALGLLEKASEGRPFLAAFIKADPIFDSIRGEPRYRAVLRKMGLER